MRRRISVSESELCAYCGEPAGPQDWAHRQWGRIEEASPSGVLVTRNVHAKCYLYHMKSESQSNTPKFKPAR